MPHDEESATELLTRAIAALIKPVIARQCELARQPLLVENAQQRQVIASISAPLREMVQHIDAHLGATS